MASGKLVNAPTWNTSSDGFSWTRFPNGFIYAYKEVQLTSGTTKDSTLYPNSYTRRTDFSISDIPFITKAIAIGDVMGSYPTHLKLDTGVNWNRTSVNTLLCTDNPSASFNCRIVIIGF